ncbi:MAG: hypothetical protein VX938_07965, partial [Myxococcota bacterium]|nr:hypothetical protein [Myxococcota bacterium]
MGRVVFGERWFEVGTAVRRRGVFGLALAFVMGLSGVGTVHGASPHWKVTVTEGTNLVRGLELEVVEQGFVHHMLVLAEPHDDKIDKVAYSMRRSADLSATPVSLGVIMIGVEKGTHVVVNQQTRPLTNLRDYTTCIQSYDGVAFDEAFVARVKGMLAKLEKTPVERTPQSVARLAANKSFQELHGVVVAQMKRLRPVAEQAWKTFSFDTCEAPVKLSAHLKASGVLKGVELDDAELVKVEGRDED